MKEDSIILNVLQVEDRLMVMHDGNLNMKRQGADPVMADKTLPKVPTWLDGGWAYTHWGDDDLLPTMMRQKVASVPIAGATLKKKVDMMLGKGLIYYKNADLAKGVKVERAYIPEVEDFLNDNRIHTEWFPAQCADFCLPFNTFSELILSKDKSKITNIFHISAEHARVGKHDKITNKIENLYYSYHFPFGTAQQDENREEIPLYRWYEHDKFLKTLRGDKFAWHTRFPMPGLIVYAWAWWIGLFKKDGWLDVSGQVPKIVSAMQKNQISLKYIIAIPETYFRVRHIEWDTMDSASRQAIVDRKVTELNDNLTGTDNVFKSISYIFKENEVTGAPLGKIEITSVDDKAKTGTWVPDSFAADAQIVQGFGMDPSQIGLQPDGGKMGAGSGSDKRESYNLMITLNTPDQTLVLEPLNLISRYNKWGITFVVDHEEHTTTNDQESGIKPSDQSTQIIKK